MANNMFYSIIGETGDERIRGCKPGMSIDEVIDLEGKDYTEFTFPLQSIMYLKELEPGKKLRLAYNFGSQRVLTEMNIFFEYNLYQHNDQTTFFDQFVEDLTSHLSGRFGNFTREVKGRGANKETYFTWKLPDEANKDVTLIISLHEDPEDSTYDQNIAKLIYAKTV